ncbi:family 20 glycosylhydrolase [Bacteroides sp. 519]|uniref:family 20 glycosylhydrolase n=1 Tax=Bacteroides sp. 519 TaxID=2302937 RepID=UPI0013D39830|nr:family 20 glycosylhydrolase [Bacteroides sp. 519]NDV57038.1 beta-N-acetylhexosaminidase [Bacteroides sp. 519]
MKRIKPSLLHIWLVNLTILCSCTSPVAEDKKAHIIPAPERIKAGNGLFTLQQKNRISYSDQSLKGLADSLSTWIHELTGLVSIVETSTSSKGKIHLELTKDKSAFNDLPDIYGNSPKEGDSREEQYLLSIGQKNLRIQATAPEGIYRGMTSLRQLIGGNIDSKGEKVYLPSLEIKDSPRFAWRGLSLDVSRCFFTAEEVKQVIRMLSLYKMNVLHLHLTDNQGWRIEIKKHPKLTEIGSKIPNDGKPEGYYTQEQFKELVQYAADHFVTIVPEIDFPGHATALFTSYPEFENAVKIKMDLGIAGQTLGALDVDDAKAMQFVEDVITELAAITAGSYIHIGGDETVGLAEDKYIRFMNKARQYTLNQGKKIVGWQEITRADITENDLYQHWIYFENSEADPEDKGEKNISPEVLKLLGESFMKAAKDIERGVSKNAKTIVSPTGLVYLDHRYKEPSADTLQRIIQEKVGFTLLPKKTIQQMYEWDPSTLNPLLDPSQNIAGVEGAIWCETITNFKELQFMLMPRLAGIAEKGWSKVENTYWEEYRVRLSSHTPLWENMNWYYFKSSMVDWKQ